ncbi:MAG: OmpA family protein [Tannerella sp.]|jgi:peptidoglycan-associated lipoprotein|nr:OmpA family protein [Tannerella sp.]
MRFIHYIGFILMGILLFSCKTVKLSVAEEKQSIGEYYEAANMYRKLYSKAKPSQRDMRAYVSYRMGICYQKINNTTRATSAYMNALRYNYPDSLLNLRLAQTYHQGGRYNEAINYYNKFLEQNPESTVAKNGLEGCALAAEMKENPTLYQVRKMDIFNSRYGEFSPMLTGDSYEKLYFASSRAKSVNKDSLSSITGQLTNNFFLAEKDEKGTWKKPVELEDAINTLYDEGTPSISSDGNTMYYTYCESDPISSRTAEIYTSTRSGASWGIGSRVNLIKDSVTSVGHPSISPDGKYLYFVSDVSSYGGKDIFRARLMGMNDFAGIENLGPQINTEGDEMFPYVRDSVTIYFASNGHPGMGGLDLFKATMDSLGVWHVENMGAPINSMGDDFGITFEGNREKGFFSSNRNDARGYDHIYSFERPTVTIFIEGYVSDAEENPIENALVRIVGKDGLNEKVFAKPDGSYKVELERDISYVMMASAPEYLNQHFELTTDPDEKNETYYVDFYLSPIHKPTVVENIFYDFDKATLRPESEEALDDIIKVLNENPNVTIEMGAHTDRKGSDKYNEGLAQRRAQSVVDYLIEAGIPSDRLSAKGYGKSEPKTVTKKMAEENDFLEEDAVLTEEYILTLTPEQQEIADQYNRRTEFKVTGTTYNLY